MLQLDNNAGGPIAARGNWEVFTACSWCVACPFPTLVRTTDKWSCSDTLLVAVLNWQLNKCKRRIMTVEAGELSLLLCAWIELLSFPSHQNEPLSSTLVLLLMTPEDPEINSLTLFFSQKFFVAPTSGVGSGRRTLQVLQPSAVNKNLGRIIEVLNSCCHFGLCKV